MSSTPKKRLDYIDATKGVAILCITFLHFEKGVIPGWLNTWIGLFMITAFYVTSGWLTGISTKELAPTELFKKRIRQIGIPYLWFSLLIILFDVIWVLCSFMESDILLRDIYKTVTLRGIGTLWFLPALLFGEYLFSLIRNSKHKWLAVTIGIIATIIVNRIYYSQWYPLRNLNEFNKIIDAPLQVIKNSVGAWPIIAIGYLLAKKWAISIVKMNKAKLMLASAIIFAISFILVICPPFTIYYVNGLLCNILPAIAFMCLFIAIGNNLFSRFFIYWGRNSLILMCTHFSITMEILMVFDKYILHHTVFEGPRTLIYFAICILMTYPLVSLFNGKLKFMLGK